MSVKRLYQVLISALIFLIPTNLFLVLTEVGSRVHGLRIDYLLPKFWAIDLLIWVLIFLWIVEEKQHHFKTIKKWQKTLFKKPKKLLVVVGMLSALLITRQFLAVHNLIAIWTLFSWIKLSFLAVVLYQKRQLLTESFTYKSLAITVLFQSLVGLWQFFTQHSVATYWFLGETNISSFAGLAKSTLGGVERVLPYGTTAHPNVLGGFMSLSLLLLIPFWRTRKDSFVKSAIALCMGAGLATLIATQSLSAWLTLGVGIVIILWRPLFTKLPSRILLSGIIGIFLLSIWLPLPADSLSVTRRQYLNQAALRMSIHHPFIGVGVQNFTTQVEKYSPSKEVVRFVQPAHNAVLLFFAETGILGLMLVLLLCKLCKHPTHVLVFLPLLPILLLDHYLLTIQSGNVLMLFYFIQIKTRNIP